MNKLLIVSALTVLSVSQGKTCPLGPNEEKLTLQRVMRNFDKYTRLADASVRMGSSDPTSVSDSDLEQVISDFVVFNSCVDAVLNSEGLDLFPSKAKSLSGKELEDYKARYLDYITRLKAGAISYSAEFENLKLIPAEQRSFAEATKIRKAFDDLVSEAHYSF